MATDEDSTDNYRIKDITFFGSSRRILLQSKNGPCPLLAMCNVLLLRNALKINPDARYISFFELVDLVSNWLFESNEDNGGDSTSSRAVNLRENLSSCLEILPKLNVGLDVNVKFGGVIDFEYTQETTVFDLLDIMLFHGWVIGQEDTKSYEAFGHLSYNQVVERLIAHEELQQSLSSGNPLDAESQKKLEEGMLIKDFFDRTASQISYEGLLALHETVRERQIGVFFRNSHFNTMLKYEGKLYLLCTDIAFGNSNLCWERFDEVDGDTEYVDADFRVTAEAEGGLSAEDAAAIAAAEAAEVAAVSGQGPPPGDADAQLAWQMMQEDLRAEQEEVYAQAAAAKAKAAPKATAKVAPAPKAKSAGSVPAATKTALATGSEGKKKSGKSSCAMQ
mmetsp:Transcript_56166/g.100041  ORF Transcript_56166/g.100041 Transcript_56166/m.100041 type:complete len:392 (-) Transcript_56166:327-1502(-)|eukprot:CAMPEP_0197664178 /NCGR_PEP_ID=MMETSP1338-20131121/58474_1 /TAXON_ID=43686 ORGANISM="Pelagodinium beii, Strain RCC1491" /NCGR_SAMPLE_ID=MMETSP1338 /ASSEMBLY_ACC=CAM_ASM_000754 /LENGTH=391 /DNA_ID=CAMNT_0043242759 /DNA_START=36 /DNA_END=1211 /DNA_ORIENTATION=-